MTTQTIKRYQKKTLSALLNQAQRVFNSYIRKRDSKGSYFTCISCQKPKGLGQMHAGHYYSQGHHPTLRFNENNVHGQCIHCNTYLHGNLIEYRKHIENKIGKKELDELELQVAIGKRMSKKWDRFEIIDIIEIYREKLKLLK